MWTARIRHHRTSALAWLIAGIILFVPSARVLAVDSSIPQSVNLVQPSPPPPQPPADRQGNSGAAIAAAAAGAAMAGMGCAMMMDAARKELDPEKAQMMMAMAMQQCAQAASNLANMGDNQKAKDALVNPASTPSLQTSASSPAPAPSSQDFKLPDQATETPTVAAETPATTPTDTNSGVVAPSVFEKSLATAPSDQKKMAATGVYSSGPNVIPEAKVGFDDNAKAGEATAGSGGAPSFAGTGAGTPAGAAAAAKDLKQLLEVGDSRLGGKSKSAANGETHGEGSAGEAKNEKGNDSMSDMLAQLMGGGAPPPAADTASNQVMNLKEFAKSAEQGSTEDLPNIFQYASYRYRQLGQEAAVGIRKNKTPGILTAQRGPAMPLRSSAGKP